MQKIFSVLFIFFLTLLLTRYIYVYDDTNVYDNTTKMIEYVNVGNQKDAPIMHLYIDKINISNDIYSIYSKENNIEKNAYLVKDSKSPEDGMIIIGAHSGYGKYAYFNDLYKLKFKDEIRIDYNNKTFMYYVSSIYNDMKDGYIKVSSNCDLILFTCNKNLKNNYLVVCANHML